MAVDASTRLGHGRASPLAGYLSRAGALGLLALVVIALPIWQGDSWTTNCSIAAIYAIVGISLNILVGYTGQISLGQQAFLGIGAMAAANLANSGTNPADPFSFVYSIVAAAVFGAVSAIVLGVVALRIRGLYLALVTLIFGAVTADAIFTLSSLNGHDAGVAAVRPTFVATNAKFYVCCVVLVVVAWYVDWSLRRSKTGRALVAIRESEPVAQAFGINVMLYKLLGFAVSGALAGLAGGLFAFKAQSFSDKDFTSAAGFNLALIFIVMVVVGGLGSRAGVLVASAFFGLLPWLLDNFFSAVGASTFYIDHKNYLPGLIGSVLLIQTVVMNPGGLGQVVHPITSWFSGGRSGSHAESEPVGAAMGGVSVRT